MRVSVIGGSVVGEDVYEQARKVGEILAAADHEVVCGGLGGVMEGVCRGAKSQGGRTIGILPGDDRGAANPYVDTPIATGMGNARNALVALNGDAVVAIDGSTGTLSEIGLALDHGRPVAGLGTHRIDGVAGIEHVETPQEAVTYVESVA